MVLSEQPGGSEGTASEPREAGTLRGRRDDTIASLRHSGKLWPVVDINACPRCFSPRRSSRGICGSCIEVGKNNPRALDSFEAITISSSASGLERVLASYKNRGCSDQEQLEQLAAPLSSYLETHREALRLTDKAALFTAVPSSTGVIAAALAISGSLHWFGRAIEHSGVAADPDRRQRHRDAATRQALTHADWRVVEDVAVGRDVILLDDLMTSGASLHSYAKALKKAGAKRIRGVVLIRHSGGTVYRDGLQRLRDLGEEPIWSAEDRWALSLTGLL